ncbi:MAG: hypothetical protein WB816_03370 [Methylocystis sp.]
MTNFRGWLLWSFATLFTALLFRVDEAGKFHQSAIFVMGAAPRGAEEFFALLGLGH